jgi:hypothetical protein
MNKNSMRNCRLTPLPKNNNTIFEDFSKKIQHECGDEERTPSRCDRFLIRSDSFPSVHLLKSNVLLPSSDHNAIYTLFDTELERPNVGGRRKHTKVTTHRRRHSKRKSRVGRRAQHAKVGRTQRRH